VNFYIIGGVAFAAFFSGWMVNGWRYDAEIAQMNADNAQAVTVATQTAMAETNRLQGVKDAAISKANQRAQINAASAAAARSELDRLRDDLNNSATTPVSDASCGAISDYASTLKTVFAECAGSLEALAGKADNHFSDYKTLSDSWPKGK